MIFASPLARGAGMAALWMPIEFVASYGGVYVLAFLLNIPAPWFCALAYALLAVAMTLPAYVLIIAGAEREYWANRPQYTPPPKVTETTGDGFTRIFRETTTSTFVYYLPCTVSQLAELTRGLANNRSLSFRRWCGKGKPFSQAQYRNTVDEMIRRGLAERVGASTVLTEIGAQALEHARVSPTGNDYDG